MKYLLLQVRRSEDPMRDHEIECFGRELGCAIADIATCDLISGRPSQKQVEEVDAILIGGSGDYSVVQGGTWLPGALATFQWLYENSKPTFASCWGFQAFARALRGKVETDLSRAEVGTIQLSLTEAGLSDPVFGPLGRQFWGQMGHQDIVVSLPENAVRLASSNVVENEAFTFPGKPIYSTQFHPELRKQDLIKRVVAYPEYIERVCGQTIEEFKQSCRETSAASGILSRFVERLRPLNVSR